VKAGGVGGANTISGLHFEKKCDLLDVLRSVEGYDVGSIAGKPGSGIFFEGKLVARAFRKGEFYKFLKENGIDWKDKVSCRLFPDDAILVFVRKTLHIIEIKFQKVAGSVDEKLQTCDFKRKQYTKLVEDLDLAVAYIYVLDKSWFDKPKYKDVLDYIRSVNCNYCFDELPLAWLGLPTVEQCEGIRGAA
jgi:hypothetical protein